MPNQANKLASRTILNVSFKDKNKVKMLGAKWDPAIKSWYLPPGKDSKAFQAWLPKKSDNPSILINNIGIARGLINCWSCKGHCTICAIYCREISDKPNKSEQTESKTGFFILTELSELPDSLIEFITLRCPNYRLGKVGKEGYRYYRNHCDHCSMGLSDARLHKLGDGFNPKCLNDCKLIKFIDLLFLEELKVSAQYIDYSDNELILNSIETADYLTDYI